ncbi:non-ribosomal peptide synthetase [Streptomyces buecherae]|uniref:Non-ribosomal peptide synthetase n=2 Tax=Streptomyces buecherae TaxID=2763006 RepID=A0A7H8NJN8_9ACTN|nr:non-ribosomal peptide synthetase [Streptomyces buecherae]
MEPESVAQLLRKAARSHPDAGMRYLPDDPMGESAFQSYPFLLAAAERLAAGLARRGLAPGDPVGLLLDRPRDVIPAFWGCVLGGFVPCPLPPLPDDADRTREHLAHLGELLDGPLLLTTEPVAGAAPRDARVRMVPIGQLHAETETETEPGPARDAAPAAVTPVAPDGLALLVLTSGSTGRPKAVRLTHANLLASMAAKAERQRLTGADRTLNWIAFDHVAALLEAHLLPLAVGAEQFHVSSARVLGDPMEFLRLISRHRVTMTFTPNFLLGLLNAADAPAAGAPAAGVVGEPGVSQGAAGQARGGAEAGAYDPRGERLDLRSLRHIVSGGEANVRATGEAFLARYAPYGLRGDALWPAFGMTETCAGSVYSRGFPRVDAGREFASLGQPVRGLRVRVADARGRVCPAGEVGELQLRGPMITDGYHHDPAATARAHTPDGWFRSGDLGRIDGLGDGAPSLLVGDEAGTGHLVLVGRAKDSVIVNGVNYFSPDIEAAIERLDGVAPGHVAAFPTRQPGHDTEQLVVALRPEPAAASGAALHRLLTTVRATVVAHWGFRPAHVLPLPASAFPRTSLGKTLRQRMRERLEAGAYDAVIAEVAAESERHLGGHVAPEGATERALADIYAELFEREPARVSATASFFDLGGTSLDILRLRRLVATRLAVADLPVITVLTAPTVRRLAARLDAGPPAATGPAAYDPVVPLQTGGDKTPLFCVHPGVGEVLVFVNLARYFAGDRPFFALRARGFNAGERPFDSFAEMVETYVRAIRARQPRGPYAIAGYSYGGAVAFEIAKRLEALGERVGFVGSLNLPPHIKYRMDELDFVETATNLALFLDLVDRRRALELPAELRALPADDRLARLLDLAPPRRLRDLDLDLPKFTAWARLASGLTALGREYRPSGTVRSMTVFYAEPLRGTKEDWLARELRRWDEHTRSQNRYVEVPGEHYTMLGPRHVATFQAILRRELDRALGEGSP